MPRMRTEYGACQRAWEMRCIMESRGSYCIVVSKFAKRLQCQLDRCTPFES